jgi:hypothetical protein
MGGTFAFGLVVAILFSLHRRSFSADLEWLMPIIDVYHCVEVALEHAVIVFMYLYYPLSCRFLLSIFHSLVSAIDLDEQGFSWA